MGGLVMGVLGSGEFEPWAEGVDRWLLEHSRTGDGRVLVLPTASAPEGDEAFDRWATKGLDHYALMGVPAEVVPLKTREDAAREDLIAMLDGASEVFFSGGNPAYLSATLADTPFWRSLLRAMDRGLAYGGSSAGVACLPEIAPDSTVEEITSPNDVWRPGLHLFADVLLMPHWDALDSFRPGLTALIIESVAEGWCLFAIDEDTAAVGDGTEWFVMGAGHGAVHVMLGGTWQHHGPGSSFTLPLARAMARVDAG